MKIQSITKNGNARQAVYVLIGLAISAQFLTGCASHDKTYKETTTVSSVPADSRTVVVSTEPTTQTTTTTVHETNTETRATGGSILGGIFHVVGEIIAFPFKLIGAALEAIF